MSSNIIFGLLNFGPRVRRTILLGRKVKILQYIILKLLIYMIILCHSQPSYK